MFERSDLSTPFCGVTFECAYGESRAELVQAIESKNYVCVGGATTADLVSAALRASDVTGREALEGASIATQLMIVVLHAFDGKHAVLVAAIPIHSEAGEKISNLALRLREVLFRRKLYLTFAGGDGAKANLEVWRLIKLLSHGNNHAKLKDAERPEDLPFGGGSGNKEHGCKGLFHPFC